MSEVEQRPSLQWVVTGSTGINGLKGETSDSQTQQSTVNIEDPLLAKTI